MPQPKKPPLPPAPDTVYVRLTYTGPVMTKDREEALKWRAGGATVIPYDKRPT
jgi:hypothetical protein